MKPCEKYFKRNVRLALHGSPGLLEPRAADRDVEAAGAGEIFIPQTFSKETART
jgi:hypothetical protein